ncbi:MAG: methyltransferase domain-containing protein [Bacteroidales bacterium]|nr:methyltransferase domain-containing protein [Bacteroidales bacterium]
MRYSEILKGLFEGITLKPEDLLHLETFQIKCLPDRIPKMEFSALLRANPVIHRFLISKYPPIDNFINSILKENKAVTNKTTIEKYCQELLWEIADLTVYNKYPEVYDVNTKFNWRIKEISSVALLRGKTIIDAGAGTGQLAFLVANTAKTVFAVEPVSSFRHFMREKALNEKVKNLYVLDGFLDCIPLPDNSVDVLMTSNAIGWNLEEELNEIERVVVPNGHAIHLLRTMNNDYTDNPFHDILKSSDWNYACTDFSDSAGLKLKYFKTIKKD